MSKCVLITGAVRNSGLGMARKFLSEGWTTIITSRAEADAKQVASELQQEFGTPCYGFGYVPAKAKEEVEILFEKIEKAGLTLDSVICNAADLGRWMDPLTVDVDDWAGVLHTNVVGYFAPARMAARQMIQSGKAKGGTVIFIGSINYKDALPERSAYVASKGAIRSMTKALALDLGGYGIRVNCIAPGPIWTTRYDEMDPVEAEARRQAVPLKSITTKENMGEIAFFLASDASQNMTGSVMVVDGGMDSAISGGY
ncbi:MAG: SDR family oxidoreductase [Clostridia bacterium]|nr:SDR family oxidoreductase [Clostridia bacterium]